MNNVLVTGGAGYIGSHACKALSQSGFNPVTFDNLERGCREAVKWGPLFVGDLRDKSSLDRAFYTYNPCAVFHFAAYAYVGESVSDPMRYFENNVCGSINLIKVMQEYNVNSLIFSSTCATYGIPDSLPIYEDDDQRPINPYGSSKLIVERIIKDLSASTPLRCVILRYFNASGSDPDGLIGENHHPETHLIPIILDVAAGRRSNLTINGGNYETADGTCIRDYVHVSDLAAAHVLALDYLAKGGETISINLGNGNGFSVKEVVAMVEKVTGRSIQVELGPKRLGDPAVLSASSVRATELLGWRPTRSSLATQIEDAWRWWQRAR